MDTIEIQKLNEVYLRVNTSLSICKELYEYFAFFVPGYKFMPAYKNKIWNGQIRLFDLNKQTLYLGLLQYLHKFAQDREYELIVDDNLKTNNSIDLDNIIKFANDLELTVTPRDYQIDSFKHCIEHDRALLLSPTASGKSLLIYLLTRWYNTQTLIVVPTVSLTQQMYKDFESYSSKWSVKDQCHIIMQGQEKITNKPIVISTWQSIFRMPLSYFTKFNLIIGDEAHLFKAKSLTSILTKLHTTPYRFGTTGTLNDSQTHKYVLEGLFGPVFNVVTTKELIDNKHLANFSINALVLDYDEETKQQCKTLKYQQEMDFLVGHKQRNKFICNLVESLTGNSLLLFQYVDKHGKLLYNLLKDKIQQDRKLFFVSGNTNVAVREEVRKLTEEEHNAIIVASFGTFSTGINIRNLHNIIFASPSKSKIRNLQSIGRGLRKSDVKDKAILYDIADNLQYKSRQNYTLEHFQERIKQYTEQEFEYRIFNIPIKSR